MDASWRNRASAARRSGEDDVIRIADELHPAGKPREHVVHEPFVDVKALADVGEAFCRHAFGS